MSKDAEPAVEISAAKWPFVTIPAVVLVLMLGVLLSVPPAERQIDTDHFVYVTLGITLAMTALAGYGWRRVGGDAVRADSAGLAVRSKRRGDRRLPWSQVVEIGWVVPGRYHEGGLACRLRDGGAYDTPGPNIAGWLCHPGGRVRPASLVELRQQAERHGVAWRDYAPAEVM